MIPVHTPTVRTQALGEHTRLVIAGTFIGSDTAAACEEAVGIDFASGARDFVFDLSHVGRYDTGALRSIADLWRRLHGLDCAVIVAARHPGVVGCLNRVIPARWTWTLKPTRHDALIHLLARPV